MTLKTLKYEDCRIHNKALGTKDDRKDNPSLLSHLETGAQSFNVSNTKILTVQ